MSFGNMTELIMDEFSEPQGWSLGTQLELALGYIDNQQSPEAWRDFLASVKAIEDEEAGL